MSDDPRTSLAALDGTLDHLEASLAPLFARPWAETLAGLEPLQRAKADVLLAYAINDLVWVYLKSRGLDPEGHDVAKELERIRGYYGKVKDAENPGAARRTTIDKAAAHRFVTAAIPASQRTAVPANAHAALAARQAAEYDVGRATRFKHVAGETERVVPGQDGGEDVEMEDAEEEEEGEGDSDASAAELLLSVDAEIEAAAAGGEGDAEGEGEEAGPEPVESKAGRRRSGKRKRAEDLA
ncbi:hypothetical protein VHUM_00078 [Vanrija humicola]|uniref:Exosome complex protein n=1 Tax=Vanrija humicola TaxID=5417 RepID=A0A7D8V2E5_VANHU|nr:hypothetical protein VHUM_00078 [Vanrija humicola]